MAPSAAEQRKYFLTNSRVKEVQAHQSKVHSVAWSCDGRRLASGSLDKTVGIFSLDKDKLSKDTNLRGHTDSVDQLCWHPKNPDQLASASGDKSVRLWDARSTRSLVTIPTKGENINMCWSPDANTIAVGNKDDLVTFIDVRAGKPRMDEKFKFEVNEISWNKQGDLFFLTSGQGTIHILTYPDLKVAYVLNAHPANCICIKFDPTGKYFATGSADALLSVWDTAELVCIQTLSRLDWPIRSLSFNYDGTLIASASEDLVIDIADIETGQRVADIVCESPTFEVAWNPKRNVLAYACDDKDKYDRERDAGTVKLWGLPSDN